PTLPGGQTLILVLASLVAYTPPGAAQTDRTAMPAALANVAVDRFTIEASPIQLTGPVRPGEYLGVVGPAAAWLGTETGAAELWVHPIKVASDFRLNFTTPQYGAPIRGDDVARTVEVRPELTTITYSHAAFQVKQHILAPDGEPGLLVLLEVDTPAPMEIIVEFQPVLNYMWPGSIGGQYAFWDADRRVFVLSESLQTRNAMVGSPWAVNSVEYPAHQLGEAPRSMVLPVDPDRARREFIPIAAAAGTASRDEVFATFRRIISEAEEHYRKRVDWAAQALSSTTSVTTPDPDLDLALEWAKINLEEQRVCNPDLGCGFVAGWGLSGNGTRPGFGWFFGGDAAINTFAMDALGQWELVAEELAFLARYQRDDGKITHEISQAAAHVDWFEAYPYPYYHADTTPYWMRALYEYWQASGDDELVEELWPAYAKAWAWCLSAETDGDGIIENTVGGYGAIEVGDLGEALHQDIYLASVWVAALEGTLELAEAVGDTRVADEATGLADRARRTLNERYWRPGQGQHAFGILAGGGTNENLTAWPATAAAFGLLDGPRARQTLRKLAGDQVSSDWGAHMLATGSPLYDPLHYNNGTVWPFVTGFVSWGQYRYRRPWAGYHLMDAVKQMTFDWSLGRHGELFSGSFYQPLDQTVPHQFFATSMLVTPLLRGLVGWEPKAPRKEAHLVPQLPADWPEIQVDNLRAGETSLDVRITQSQGSQGGTQTVRVEGVGPPLTLTITPDVPVGASSVAMTVNGGETDASPGASVSVEWSGNPVELSATWVGGLAVAPPRFDLIPGQASHGLRVLDLEHDGGAWALTLEGTVGRTYTVELFGPTLAVETVEGSGSARVEGAFLTLDVEGSAVERQTVTVRLIPAG
ncbi:MAG: GH116 family glycosyl hydrolase, partial [Gemmatimonadota bacterium]|nr:GH116 family glycosyl hydrolase [Gemmatimonadota bacterium]